MLKLRSLKCNGFKRLKIVEGINFSDGNLLIHGRNESGKSTVMEAIHYGLYGTALRPSKNASNEDLINYGYPQAVIELSFTIDENEYHVKRVIKKKGTNVHELIINRPDSRRERITGARAVNSQILEELHGIDSDALLNSCLVEQKELGKLEEAVRSKRIEAMTSLLNLEAFIKASQEIRTNTNQLEKKNLETSSKLEIAKLAKKDYEEAEEKKNLAINRIQEIEEDLKNTKDRIKELDEIIEIIEKIKSLNRVIDNKTNKKNGLLRESNRIEKSLQDAKNAEIKIQKIQKEIPDARNKLIQVTTKYAALEELISLNNDLQNAEGEKIRAIERLENAKNKVNHAQNAKDKLLTIEGKINRYNQSEAAQSVLPKIEKVIQEISNSNSEMNRINLEINEIKKRLTALQNAEEQLNKLISKENELKNEKEQISRNRTIGIGSVILGLIAIIGYSLTQMLLPIGGVIILIGVFLFIKNSPSKIDLELNNIIKKRESLLSDSGRITEYRTILTNIQEKNSKRSENIVLNERELKTLISNLPSQPQQYSKIFEKKGILQESVQKLRANIQKDLITLGKLTTEKNENEKLAETLYEEQKNKEKYVMALHSCRSNINSLDQQCIDIQKEYNISIEQSDSIKNERDEAQKKVNELETNLLTYRDLASQKESIENDLAEINADITGLESEIIGLEKEKEEYLLDERVKLDEEDDLRIENDSLKRHQAGLETEKKERQTDINEAESTMAENFELKEKYPALIKQVENERFEIKAMNNAITLLDVTRDGIMAGVKTRIESHMIQFLPALTDQRYSMARIDEKNYRIEVYDKEARRWRTKGVFSGATQDQFSLALRLAFALSTIPSTRGARPGFIFLDEPLSGFDLQRRKGFMTLLHNELPKYFDQIIVISHLEALQEEFPNHLLLEAGRIISS